MTTEASLLAVARDLMGDDAPPRRPTVATALRTAAPGTVTAARDGDRPVALVVLADGSAYSVADECPHDGRPLSDGFVDGDRLVCARHGWEVEVCTGRCPARPLIALRTDRVC